MNLIKKSIYMLIISVGLIVNITGPYANDYSPNDTLHASWSLDQNNYSLGLGEKVVITTSDNNFSSLPLLTLRFNKTISFELIIQENLEIFCSENVELSKYVDILRVNDKGVAFDVTCNYIEQHAILSPSNPSGNKYIIELFTKENSVSFEHFLTGESWKHNAIGFRHVYNSISEWEKLVKSSL